MRHFVKGENVPLEPRASGSIAFSVARIDLSKPPSIALAEDQEETAIPLPGSFAK